MNLLDYIAKRICSQSSLNWVDIALKIGIDVNDIDKIKKKENSVIEFVSTITNKIWEEIFKFVDILSGSEEYVKITNIDKLVHILSGDIKPEDVNETSKVDVLEEIANRLAEWKIFGRVLGFQESYIENIERKYPLPDSYNQRNLELMKHLSHPLPPNTSWEFWRQYLDQFENGRLVITEIEETFPDLLSKVDSGAHKLTNDEFKYFGHPFQYRHWDSFDKKYDNTEIAVRLGYKTFVEYQSMYDWISTQKQYSNRYTILQEINSFNYVNIGSNDCPILNTLKIHLDNTSDSGFVVKGYHFVDHICLFKPGLFAKDIFDDHYFCFIVNNGVVLYITSCSEGKGHALHRSTRNIQIANLLHKELNSNEILQINVIVCNDQENYEYCNTCKVDQLYVAEEIFKDYEKFLSWYNNIVNIIRVKQRSSEDSSYHYINDRCQKIKNSMFVYEALENINLPSFSYCPEDQVEELEKIIVLTPPQMSVLYASENHIVIRGSYGCGKSVVLEKRFEKVIVNIDAVDVSYLMCHDQQSEFSHHMKTIQAKYPEKNIIVCQSKDIVPSFAKPKLSAILTKIKSIWQNKRVHIFIDEFSGSYFDEKEISELQEILIVFKNSHIVISLQSMEENVTMKNTLESVDVGYQFDYLCENTSFAVYNLQHSLRCSYEINEFVKATARIVESSHIHSSNLQNFQSKGKFVDKEFAADNFERKLTCGKNKNMMNSNYTYNLSDTISHTVRSGSVRIYYSDKAKLTKNVDVSVVYMSVLSYILNEVSREDRYVICTYSKRLYNTTAGFLESNLFIWTNRIDLFTRTGSEFEILLTDYASVRGYEFPNLVFLAPLGSKFLRYRFVECLTRATTKLFIVTDNRKITKNIFSRKSEYDVDLKLLDKWKDLDCSVFYDVRYDKSNDYFRTVENGETVVLKENVSEMIFGYLEKFPWVDGVSLENFDNDNDGVLAVIRNLVQVDNVGLCHEFLESNSIDFSSYDNLWKMKLLELAINHNAVQILKLLIDKYNFDYDRRDISQPSLLKAAIFNKNADVIYFFLSKNSENICKSGKQSYILLLLLDRDQKLNAVVELLLDELSDVNSQRFLQDTFLYGAVCDGYFDLVNVLIDMGANIEETLFQPKSLIEQAIFRNYIDIFKIIFDKIFDINKQDGFGNTALHFAADIGNMDIFKFCFNKNANINIKNYYKNTPLHKACNNSHTDIVNFLMENNDIECTSQNKEGNTPLHLACSSGCFAIVNVLVKKYKDFDMQNNEGNTPLHLACIIGNLDIVNVLIEKCTNFHIQNNEGNTPLLLACAESHNDIINILIEKHTDFQIQNNEGDTPLHTICKNGIIKVFNILLKKDASMNIVNNSGNIPFYYAVMNCHDDIVNSVLNEEIFKSIYTAHFRRLFYAAVVKGYLELTEILIAKGVNFRMKDKSRNTPLHWAACAGQFDVIKFLMKKNADINKQNTAGETPLSLAVIYNHIDIVKLMIDKNPDYNLSNIQGYTPFHTAVAHGHINILKLLMYSNVDVSRNNKSGEIPIFTAVINGFIDIVKLLIEYSDINSKNQNGKSLLHFAVSYNQIDIVKLLLEEGANVNIQNNEGNTPLHDAAIKEYHDIRKLLINKNADIRIKNNSGKTAFDISLSKNQVSIKYI